MIWIILVALAVSVAFATKLWYELRESRASCKAQVLSIAEEKTIQTDLAVRERENFDALMETCDAAVLLLKPNTEVVMGNAPALRLLGDVVGKPLIQATMSAEMDAIARAALNGRSAKIKPVRLPSLDPRALLMTARAVGSGGALVVFHDVTKLQRLETMRQDFVANVSHELRTPLASIRAMAETLQIGAGSETAAQFLSTIVAEVDRLTRIADDLLQLADAESRKLAMEEFDLSALAQTVIRRFELKAKNGGVKLESALEAGLNAEASRDRIEQVLVNLIDNAVKYTPSGGAVHVAAARTAHGVRIDVEDTGIGIAQQHLSRIFERFYRVDRARSRESGGTGLGLSIVKNIVEAHGGTVTAESEFNRGSAFHIFLPSPINQVGSNKTPFAPT